MRVLHFGDTVSKLMGLILFLSFLLTLIALRIAYPQLKNGPEKYLLFMINGWFYLGKVPRLWDTIEIRPSWQHQANQ